MLDELAIERPWKQIWNIKQLLQSFCKEEKGRGRRNLPGLSSLKWPPGLQHLCMQQAALRSYVIIFSIM